MIKEPMCLSTDNLYILTDTCLASTIKERNVDEEKDVLNITLSIPIKDIKHMEMNSYGVDNPTSTSVKNILSAFSNIVEKHNKADANIISVPDFVWNKK